MFEKQDALYGGVSGLTVSDVRIVPSESGLDLCVQHPVLEPYLHTFALLHLSRYKCHIRFPGVSVYSSGIALHPS